MIIGKEKPPQNNLKRSGINALNQNHPNVNINFLVNQKVRGMTMEKVKTREQSVEYMINWIKPLLERVKEIKDYSQAMNHIQHIYFDFMDATLNSKFFKEPFSQEEIIEISKQAMDMCLKLKEEKWKAWQEHEHENFIKISATAKLRKYEGEAANRGKEIRHWYYTRTGGGQIFTEWINMRLEEVESRMEFACLKAEVKDMLRDQVISLSEADNCYRILQKFAVKHEIEFK